MDETIRMPQVNFFLVIRVWILKRDRRSAIVCYATTNYTMPWPLLGTCKNDTFRTNIFSNFWVNFWKQSNVYGYSYNIYDNNKFKLLRYASREFGVYSIIKFHRRDNYNIIV